MISKMVTTTEGKTKKQNKHKQLQKSLLIIQTLGLILILSNPTIIATTIPGTIYNDQISIEYRNITVYAPAVGQTANGYTGVISTITVTIESNGSGRVFVDTLPLTQIDMQGSARLAVNVATAYVAKDKSCNVDPYSYDYFFVIRADSPVIGGPSAGGIMTSAVIALLENWKMDDKTVMTGMINPDGSIGPIGGIPYKIDAAHSVGATRFLIPQGQNTYTEQVYETIPTSWGQQIVSRTVTKNVSEYAMETYGMEVVEVSDINEVTENLTGYRFPVAVSNESISTVQYLDSMKPLATKLLGQSETSLTNASTAFDNADIPNYFPNYYRNTITDYLNSAEDAFDDSQQWFSKDRYYTSTSKSFQSLINSRFVSLVCDYFSTDDKQTFIDNLLSETQSHYTNESNKAKNTAIEGAISLQCVGAAQKRASEAASYLNSAQTLYQQGDEFTTLYQIAFAIQRIESIGWWLGLTSYFNDTDGTQFENLESLSNNYIQDAQQSITYSEVILQEMGQTSSFLTEAQQMLDSAQSDQDDGYYAAALFEALEALSKGNLALELVDATTNEKIQSKIERANESANAGISESRNMGIEPVLAVSYYEYAESLMDSNIMDSLFYYKYSDLITGVLTLSGASESDSSSTRYVGIPERSAQPWAVSSIQMGSYLIVFIAAGAIGGMFIGLLIGLLLYKKDDAEPGNQWTQTTMPPTYYHQNKDDQPTQQESFPKNIYDFYKKN
jgi:uncharacterized protein